MFQLFSNTNFTDRSPYQYARMDYLRDRVGENYQKLVDLRRPVTGRLDSSHLLQAILISLAVEFRGNLQEYIHAVGAAERRIVPGLGLTSSYSRGRLFTEGVFYNDCPEIIIAAPSFEWSILDLWKDYRKLNAVTVLTHPITDMDVVELGVMNNFLMSRTSPLDLAIITIDIPLMAAQWLLWKAGFPDGTLEHFLTEVVLAGAVKSHLNVAFFNKVQALMGLKEYVKVRSNLTFQQFPVDGPASDLAKTVVANITSKAMTENQILSSIPVPFGTNYLQTVKMSDTSPSFQISWADQAFKMEPAGVALACGAKAGYDRMLDLIRIVNRTIIQNVENKALSSGLTSAAVQLLTDRFYQLVFERLPKVPETA